jgi:hypothetical protein
MNEREIRAMLRGATREGILFGWYVPDFGLLKRFVVAPVGAPTATYTPTDAARYCEMLRESGVRPLYRASEPAF